VCRPQQGVRRSSFRIHYYLNVAPKTNVVVLCGSGDGGIDVSDEIFHDLSLGTASTLFLGRLYVQHTVHNSELALVLQSSPSVSVRDQNNNNNIL